MNEHFATSPFLVRRFEASDRPAVLALWRRAAVYTPAGALTLDVLIHSVKRGTGELSQVWVAESSGRVVGSVGVIHENPSLAHLTYPCVASDFTERHEASRGLTEMAIRDAWERGYLKLIVHTGLLPSQLAAPLHELGFEFSRERSRGGEHVLEFYLNLYTEPRRRVQFWPGSRNGRSSRAPSSFPRLRHL